MLYSHNLEDSKFNLFKLFLIDMIEGDGKYEEPVRKVIKETKDLIENKKNYFNIDRENYSIIVYLTSQEPMFFKKLNTKKLSKNNYKHILSLIDRDKRRLSIV